MATGHNLATLPGNLPPGTIDENVDLQKVQSLAQQILENLNERAFESSAIWRDWLALTGQVRTFYSREKIVEAWKSNSHLLTNIKTRPAHIVKPVPNSSWVDVPFTMNSKQDNLARECNGRASFLADKDGELKIWMLVTVMENFAGHGHPDVPHRGTDTLANDTVANGTDILVPTDKNSPALEFDAVVLGAGQCGLAIGGRLAALGLKYAVLEKRNSVGNNWTQRYESVRQHTLREYNNLPFDRTWKENDPSLLPGKIVAEGFENYVRKYNINVWFNTDTTGASWDANKRVWLVQTTANARKRNLVCKHLVIAIGAGVSADNVPNIAGIGKYNGILLSSGSYKHSREWACKDGIVVGSGTMAHDIAQDMYRSGLRSVTMVQRSKTAIYPIEWVVKGQEGLYNTEVSTSDADAITASRPNKISRDILARNYSARAALEQDRFDALEEVGFRVDRKTPMFDNILMRYGGYYIDVGASTHIARGDIKVKSGVPIKTLTCDGIEFEDGSQYHADVIVLATGQDHDYRNQVANIIGKDVASKLKEFWGLDEEGEVRNVMKPAAPGLWLFGGTSAHARWWSRFIALGIQSDILHRPLNGVKLVG